MDVSESLVMTLAWNTLIPAGLVTWIVIRVVPRRVCIGLAFWGALAVVDSLNHMLDWWSSEPGWTALLPGLLISLLAVNLLCVVKTNPRFWHLARAGAVAVLAMWGFAATEVDLSGQLGFGLGCGLLQWSLETAYQRVPMRWLAGWLALTALTAAFVLMQSSAGKLSHLALVLTACWTVVACLPEMKRLDLRLVFAFTSLLLPTILLAGLDYNPEHTVPWISFLLVAVAPLASLAGTLPDSWTQHRLLAYLLLSLLWMIALAWAVMLALLSG